MSYPASYGSAGSPPGARGLSLRSLVGFALAIVGLGLVVYGASVPDDSPLFVLGGLVFGGGILRLTTALAKDARERRAFLSDPDDPRWHGGAGIRQLVGRTCVHCERRIVVASDGASCDHCGDPTHVDCAAPHRATAHEIASRLA